MREENRYNTMIAVREHHKEAESLGYKVFVTVLQGSQNYDLDIYNGDYKSDVDTKCIVIPSFEDFCSNKSTVSTTHIRRDNSHIDIKDVNTMFQTFKKQNVNFVEILFSDYWCAEPDYIDLWYELKDNAERIVHANPCQTVKTMCGMSMEKYKALKHPYPTIIDKVEKYGYDGKQLHHIIRINNFLKHYISGMSFSECLKTYSNRQLLIDAKLNKFTLEEAEELAKKYDDEDKAIKNDFIDKYQKYLTVDTEAYNLLDKIRNELYKRAFKEELLR